MHVCNVAVNDPVYNPGVILAVLVPPSIRRHRTCSLTGWSEAYRTLNSNINTNTRCMDQGWSSPPTEYWKNHHKRASVWRRTICYISPREPLALPQHLKRQGCFKIFMCDLRQPHQIGNVGCDAVTDSDIWIYHMPRQDLGVIYHTLLFISSCTKGSNKGIISDKSTKTIP